jgi:hypothetical protein
MYIATCIQVVVLSVGSRWGGGLEWDTTITIISQKICAPGENFHQNSACITERFLYTNAVKVDGCIIWKPLHADELFNLIIGGEISPGENFLLMVHDKLRYLS